MSRKGDPADIPASPEGAADAADAEAPRPRRKRATRGERRRDIRVAAFRCFRESGYHGTTVDHICEGASISKGAFYWYFPTKQAVFVDIIDTWADEVQAVMRGQFRSAMLADNPFQALTEALLREAHRSGGVVPVWLEFLAEAGRETYAREVLANFHRGLRRVFAELLEMTLEDTVSGAEVQALASSALALFFGLLCQELTDPAEAGFADNMRGFMTVMERTVSERTGEKDAER